MMKHPPVDRYCDVRSDCIVRGDVGGPQPLISIMIPTFRRPELLFEAISAALGQSAAVPYEVVVVDNDDGCAFDIAALVRGFRAERLWLYRNSANIGMYGNWNRCAGLARGDWFTILSDDDLLSDNYVEVVASLLRDELSFVAAWQVVRDERPSASPSLTVVARSASPAPISLRDISFRNGIGNASGVLISKSRFFAAGGFDEEMYPSADYDLWMRLCATGEAVFTSSCRSAYRISVNESLKPDVLAGFIVKDFEIRARYASQAHVRWLYRLLMKCAASRDVKFYRHKWGVDLASHPQLKTIGYRKSWALLPSRWTHSVYKHLPI